MWSVALMGYSSWGQPLADRSAQKLVNMVMRLFFWCFGRPSVSSSLGSSESVMSLSSGKISSSVMAALSTSLSAPSSSDSARLSRRLSSVSGCVELSSCPDDWDGSSREELGSVSDALLG